MSKPEKYITQTVILNGDLQKATAKAKIDNAPISLELEMIIRVKPKARTLDQNGRMWAGPLKDIAEQVYIEGRRYEDKVWHEQFKIDYLPEDDDPELERLVKNSDEYHKWGYTPKGGKVLIGSTGDLSPMGFGRYMEQIYAFGAQFGVMFSAAPAERKAA